MIKLNDTFIQADTQMVLDVLKYDLAQHGLKRFHQFRKNGENIQTSCPFHKGGQERKPSFGVNGDIDKCHCFTCGWSGTIEEMISELYEFNDDGNYGKKWLIKRFNSLEIETRPDLMEGFKNGNNVLYCGVFNRSNKRSDRILCRKTRCGEIGGDKDGNNNLYDNMHDNHINGSVEHSLSINKDSGQSVEITEEELDSYRYLHPYMYERGLTDEIIEKFDIGYSDEKDAITFPVKDISGRVRFVATRNVKTKFFGLPASVDKPVYAAYLFTTGAYKEAFITESFLNCLTCWKYDTPAMAMIGTGNKKQYEILERLPVRSYVLAFDPDEAGRKAVERFRKNVKGKIIKELVYTDDRDINDLQAEFLKCKIIF